MGAVSITEKVIVATQVREVRTFYLVLAFLLLPILTALLLSQPNLIEISRGSALLAVTGGLVHGSGLMVVWRVLRTGEVSRVIPVTTTFPIFVTILAALFFHENIGIVKWLAIVVMVAGAVLISAQQAPGGRVFISRSFALLILASMSFAVSQTLSNQVLEETPRLVALGFFLAGVSIALFTVSARRPFLQESLAIVKKPVALSWFLANACGAVTGNFLMFGAFQAGSVSLASTLVSTRPLFIFIYTVILSRFMPKIIKEPLSPGILCTKILAIAMIVGGGSQIITR
jgi:drug/metabolite transporter (DMT)-like permease